MSGILDPEGAHLAALRAASVLRDGLPAELADRVTYVAASAREVEIPGSELDIVLFSWSL